MRIPDVAVIDYGVGNLLSVRRALEHCGAAVEITSDPETILGAARVVLPGVGAFSNGMEALRANGLDAVVREVAARNTPLLAICLGMQMLLSESDEFGQTVGLGIIPGRVVPIPTKTTTGSSQKIPHIGWNRLVAAERRESWVDTYLQFIAPDEAVYFVHSFMAAPENPLHRIADCIYGGVPVAAAIGFNNILGCQFHPEKSGATGLRVLRGFLGPPLR